MNKTEKLMISEMLHAIFKLIIHEDLPQEEKMKALEQFYKARQTFSEEVEAHTRTTLM